MKKELGKTTQCVLDYITSYIEERSYPPTVREIGGALGLKSTSTVHSHLKTLENKGYIRMDPSKQRTISILKKEGLDEEHAALEGGLFLPECGESMALPLVGAVAAGNPIPAFDDVQEYLPIPRSLLHGASQGEVFLLSVEGSSMIDAGINSGDMIIVHRGIAVENGAIAVARVGKFDGDRATVKRIYFEGSTVRLQPENVEMEPIIVAREDVCIIGRVIGLIRKY